MIAGLLIVAGYATIVWAFGPWGLLAAVVHIAVMVVAARG